MPGGAMWLDTKALVVFSNETVPDVASVMGLIWALYKGKERRC